MTSSTTKLNIKEVTKWIIDSLKSQPKQRKSIIAECIKHLQLSSEEMKDTSTRSVLAGHKSEIGQILSKMLSSKQLDVGVNKQISLIEDPAEIFLKLDIEETILSVLKTPSNKKTIRKALLGVLGKEVIDLNISKFDKKLSQLCKHGIVKNIDGIYYLNTDNGYPNLEVEVSAIIQKPIAEDTLLENFLELFNIKGGEFFEAYSVALLEKYYALNGTVISAKITGGSNDNGIDGVLEVCDYLGYKDKIFLQSKVRAKATINLKEVREFLGAIVSERGSRGIFITNSIFHSEALKFISKNNNLVAIDKFKLFELAKVTKYGLIQNDDKWQLDVAAFA